MKALFTWEARNLHTITLYLLRARSVFTECFHWSRDKKDNKLALDHSSFSHSLFFTHISLDAVECSSAVCLSGSILTSPRASRDANSEQTFTVILHSITRNLFSNNFLPRKFDFEQFFAPLGRSEGTRGPHEIKLVKPVFQNTNIVRYLWYSVLCRYLG
jgi:hypothetical protein